MLAADATDIIGFTVCSLDTRRQFVFLEQRRFGLLVSTLTALVRNPSLLSGLIRRRRIVRGEGGSGEFVVSTGARNEFLALAPECRSGPHAMLLMKRTLDVLRALEVKELWIEVDEDNVRATRFHEMLRARHVRQVAMPNGKRRHVMTYALCEPKGIKKQ